MNERVEELREKITTGFGINRVPKKTMDWFLKLSEEEFCDDRGMCLKYLHDVYEGIIGSGIEHLEASIVDLNRRLSAVEDKVLKPVVEKPKRTRLDGTPIKE